MSQERPAVQTRISAMASHITAAARDAFLKEGFENTSMETIARQADVSKATLYAHFSNKDALFIAVMQDKLANYEQQLDEVASVTGDTFAPRLTRAGIRLLEFMLAPSTLQMFRVIIAENNRVPGLCQSALSAGRQRSQKIIIEIFQDAAAAGELAPHDSVEAAHLFLAILKGDLLWSCLINPRQPTTTEVSDYVACAVGYMQKIYGSPTLDKS